MNGISSGVEVSEPEMDMKEDLFSILKGLEREEIEEVLSQGFCNHCQLALRTRIQSLANRKHMKNMSISAANLSESNNTPERFSESSTDNIPESSTKSTSWGSKKTRESIYSGSRNGYVDKLSPASVDSKCSISLSQSKSDMLLDDGICGFSSVEDEMLSEEQKEKVWFANVGRKNNFVHIKRIHGKQVNVLQGLELHTHVFNAEEQKKIVEAVYDFQRMGQKGQLRERTYTEPTKWMRGKGRITIQFGCCYNYAVDKNGNTPGIIRDEEVDPLPLIFKHMIKRMVRWHVLPPTCVPNSCIVNIYEQGDCIPPHIDHHDFLRPFCTVSFLTECNILFGVNLKIVGPGEFAGPVSVPLPTGSVFILNGNGANIAKHCVPAVPAKRISITFRRMDESKIPYSYLPDPELQGIRPLVLTSSVKSLSQQKQIETKAPLPPPHIALKASSPSFSVEENDFPPLGVLTANRRRGYTKNSSKA